MESRYIIYRENEIPYEEWKQYISQSQVLKTTPPRTGINPFNKKPWIFYPKGGGCFFETSRGNGSIEYESGKLVVTLPDGENTQLIDEIARSLKANLRQA